MKDLSLIEDIWEEGMERQSRVINTFF